MFNIQFIPLTEITQLSFLEISRISFISQLGHKGKEGLIKKRSGDTSLNRFNTCMEDGLACFCCCCLNIFQRHH